MNTYPEIGEAAYNGVPLPGVACVAKGTAMGTVEESTTIKSGLTGGVCTFEGTLTMSPEEHKRWMKAMQGLRVYGPIWEPDTRELKAMRWLALDELDYWANVATKPAPEGRVGHLMHRAHICESILSGRGVEL